MKNKKSITTYILLVISVVALINIVSDSFFFRLDFTEDNRYTLSDATKNILKDLPAPVTVTAYFTDDLPPQYGKIKSDFKDMLVEYSALSGGDIVFEFLNPNEDEESEKKAMKSGIQPLLINMREKDQVVQKKAFLGVVVSMGEETDIIPAILNDSPMEYLLTTSIKKISSQNKPSIGFLQGHGEAPISNMSQAMNSLSVLYNVVPVNLTDTSNELNKFHTIAIIAPTDSFPQRDFVQLDAFLAKGNNIYIANNRVKGDFSTAQGSPVTTGLETWLERKGLKIEDNFVVDAKCASVQVRQQQGSFSFASNVNFPYLPIISNFADHPITKGLEGVVLQFASPLKYIGDTTKKFTPIAKTSEKSGTTPSSTYFDVRKKWTSQEFPLSNLTVAGVLSGKISGNTNSKIVIVSDGDFAVNGEGRQAQQQQPDNISLMVNSIDWLSDDTGLIELRTKGVSSRPIEEMEEGTKWTIKLLNFLLPIILIIIIGIVIMLKNKNARVRRMQEGVL